MERGSGSNRYRRHAKSSSGSGSSPLFLANNASTNAATITNTADNLPAPPTTVREQDQYMPIANVIRIMRRILPAHAKISDDAKETIQECVSEYISFITSEANDRCQREQRKTITAEDVIWAMGKLGFDDYVEPLSVFLARYRETEVERTSLRLEPFVKRSSVDYGAPLGLPPPFGQGFQMGHQGFFDAAAAAAIGGGGDGYLRDGSGAGGSGNGGGGGGGGSSSQAALAGFDPYAHFK